MSHRKLMRLYGWVFAASGALFALAPAGVLQAVNLAADILPRARPLPLEPAGFWLPLAGSMMGMIALLAWRLAREPLDRAAWDCLLLSKSLSTALFLAQAAAEGNPLYALGAAVDAPILLHLAWLRVRLAGPGPAPLCARAVLPLARSYMLHVGLPTRGAEAAVDRALGRLTLSARVYVAAGALYVRWAAPALRLGRRPPFESLPEAQREELLARVGASALERALFTGARAVLLACAYGERAGDRRP